MKRITKSTEPTKLASYRRSSPQKTWEQFKSKKNRRKELVDRLIQDQGGICAYCEIDLKPAATSQSVPDLRVEHFHPKCDNTTNINWHLDWGNLLACCHGGSQRNVEDSSLRFTSPDNSCDVPKGDKVLDQQIINPLNIPAFPPLFHFDRHDGSISVDHGNVTAAGFNVEKAKNTINELRLDANRLQTLRKPVLDKINDQLRIMISSGQTLDEARNRIARVLLVKDSHNNWPSFFSAIRSYLGSAAETHLQSINFQG